MCLGIVCWCEYIGFSEDLIVNLLIVILFLGYYKLCIYLIY